MFVLVIDISTKLVLFIDAKSSLSDGHDDDTIIILPVDVAE